MPISTCHGAAIRRRRAVLAVAILVALALGGCAAGDSATFDPAGPCVVDGRAAGAYPDLESQLPLSFRGAAPTTVDSGRHCTARALGAFAGHDLAEVRYAGATWDLGGGSGVSTVVFALPDGTPLPAAWVAEFYEAGARAAKKTDNIETGRLSVVGSDDGARLDVVNDLSFQTTVTWQQQAIVRTVIVATPIGPAATRAAHDELVEAAIESTVASVPGPA